MVDGQSYGGFDWKVRENIAFSTVAVGRELSAALDKAWFSKKAMLGGRFSADFRPITAVLRLF